MPPARATTAAHVVCVLTLLASLILGGGSAAHAHVELVDSSPAAGATVSSSTDRVVLVFGANLSSVGNDVVVRDADGHDASSGRTQVSGNTLQTPIDLVTTGRHTVDYRFVGLDGHADTGRLQFTVAADNPQSAATVPLPAQQASIDGLPTSPSVEGGSASGAAGSTSVLWLLPLAYLIGGLVLVRSRAAARRQPHRAPDDSPVPWRRPGS